MKQIFTSNQALLEVLAENGISIICDDNMRMTLTDEDAGRVEEIVKEKVPAATMDYYVEDIED